MAQHAYRGHSLDISEVVSLATQARDALAALTQKGVEEALAIDDEELLDRVQYEVDRHEVDVIRRWNTSLSSPLLQFSTDLRVAWRSSAAGYFPAALVPVTSRKTMLTVRLDKAPARNNYFSFGVSLISNITSDRNSGCFGQLRGTWGVINRRNNAQPIEIWGDGRKLDSKREITLREGDVLALYLDVIHRSCHLLLNRTVIYVFRELPLDDAQYVLGAIVCDDHCLEVIPYTIDEQYQSFGQSVGEYPADAMATASATSGGHSRARSAADYDSSSPLYSYDTISPSDDNAADATYSISSPRGRHQQQRSHAPQPIERQNYRHALSTQRDQRHYHPSMLEHVQNSFPEPIEFDHHEPTEEEMLKTIMDYYDAQDILQRSRAVFICPPTVDEYDRGLADGTMDEMYALQQQLADALDYGSRAYDFIDGDDYAASPAELYESMRATADPAPVPVPSRFPRQATLLSGIQESRQRQHQEEMALRQLLVAENDRPARGRGVQVERDSAMASVLHSQSMPSVRADDLTQRSANVDDRNSLVQSYAAQAKQDESDDRPQQVNAVRTSSASFIPTATADAKSADNEVAADRMSEKGSSVIPLASSSSVGDAKAEAKGGSFDAESTILCCICMERNKCILLVPCRHLCMCEPCSASGMVVACPICRQDIQHAIKVFL